MNCLRTGHIQVKCQTLLMGKKYTRHHHTLLHRDADNLAQRKRDNADDKEETHVPALSVIKQVLLLTYKVMVTAHDGSSTIARTLIGSGSSASFVQEQIEQHLCGTFWLS